MGVLGLGIDLVDVASFAAQLEAPGSAFAAGTFRAGELAGASAGTRGNSQRLAGRFAVKEAFIKAFDGSRAGRAPVLLPAHAEQAQWSWSDIEVRSDAWGRPTVELHGSLRAAVERTHGPVRIHVSLTHEETTAAAVVIIEEEA